MAFLDGHGLRERKKKEEAALQTEKKALEDLYLKERDRLSQMVLIPSGESMMGSENGNADEQPIHKVTLRAFYIDKYEVTQRQYLMVMGKNPSFYIIPALSC